MTDSTMQSILEQNQSLLAQNRDLERGNIEHLIQDRFGAEKRRQEASNQIYQASQEERQLQLRLLRDSQANYSNIVGKRIRASRQYNESLGERNQITGKIRGKNRKLEKININLKQIPFQKTKLEELERQNILNQARSEAQKELIGKIKRIDSHF